MGLTAAFLSLLAGISTIFGILNILGLPSEGPLLSDKLNWYFWMYLAGILLLGAIACLLARKKNYEE
jgi:hypothetical protein